MATAKAGLVTEQDVLDAVGDQVRRKLPDDARGRDVVKALTRVDAEVIASITSELVRDHRRKTRCGRQ
jgi:hypothetical protein